MNRVSKNQGLLLLSLVVLWIGLLIWQFDHSSEQARVPLTHVSGQRTTGKPTASPAGGDLQVHLERLAAIKGQRDATFATPRNIFASLLPQVEPVAIPSPAPRRGRSRGPAKPSAPPPTEEVVEEPQSEIKTDEEPVEEGPKGPTPEEIERLRIATELNQFRYVGFMAVGGGTQRKKNMAVVVKNDEMHVVQVGEVIGGEVLVKDVSQKDITLQDVASKITQVIPVTDDPGAGGQPN
ncbi:MAG: hypothetical protein H8K06_11850 [Nitrospira sp.]|uniref:Type II secretion system protein GspC N-terminal domain-containing protein n=1 Tax=Nitrospira defluvii TaxID=330214 RepID=A0ABM8SER4_9BACT|nr:hypothetical protein [Nitrospira defluvii]MCS6327766.1 hypothetical protein [Nitrospira sp.]CAE6805133.1 conserved hypothetical protein [Nitrospira defluvii]